MRALHLLYMAFNKAKAYLHCKPVLVCLALGTNDSTTSFINKQDIEPSSLKLIHHNAQSLMTNGRIDDYGTFLKILRNPFDILVFTET